MIVTKAIAAIAMTGLGSLAAGTAAYFEVNPRAQTPVGTHVETAPTPPRVVEVAPAPVVDRSVSEVVTIDPVVITTEHRQPKALARPKRPADGPCSDWQAMTTGPADRKVRMLCPH